MNCDELRNSRRPSGKLYVYAMQCLGKVHLAFYSHREPYAALCIVFSIRIQRSFVDW